MPRQLPDLEKPTYIQLVQRIRELEAQQARTDKQPQPDNGEHTQPDNDDGEYDVDRSVEGYMMHGAGPVDEESQSQKEASAPAADVNATAKGSIDDDDVYGDDRRSHFAPPRKTKRVYTSSSQEKKQKQLRKTSRQPDDNDGAPRDDDGDEPRQPANPVTPANPKTQRHPASTTAALA
ncbi:hypothetical protein KEM55_000233, partial [Ascosphaera atra]